MKLVVFAHTPNPFHGQSHMVELMLAGFGGDSRTKANQANATPSANDIQCFHIDARVSDDLSDIGSFRIQKLLRLIRFVIEAIWCRLRHRADTLYYIPAPPKRIAFYRDCLVLATCRPFFSRIIFHWEASGLANWLEHHARPFELKMGNYLLGSPDLSISLAAALSKDGQYFRSKKVVVVANGIPDPCPNFNETILPARINRLARRRGILEKKTISLDVVEEYKVAFVAHCSREKGLFAALDAIALANEQLRGQSSLVRMRLAIAGAFVDGTEQQQFESWLERYPDDAVYVGFLESEQKHALLRDSDCLCFPSFYAAEAQPVSVIEAMAFGLTVVGSDWRGIPELLPRGYPYLVSRQDPKILAEMLLQAMHADVGRELRRRFLEGFTLEAYLTNLRAAFRAL